MLRRSSSSLKRNESSPQLPVRRHRTTYCGVCDAGIYNVHKLVALRVVNRKYSASQNFFYTRDIVEILENTSTKASINIKDIKVYDFQVQNLGSYCQKAASSQSLQELAEYFKYYKDIPRLFMKPINNIYRRHHQLKRVVEYNRLKAVLNLTQTDTNNPDKQKPMIKTDAVLTGLSSLRSTYGSNVNQPNLSQSLINLREKLAKLIKQTTYPPQEIAQIDQQYEFGNTINPQPRCNISFQGISEILGTKSQSIFPLKIDMKKHSKPRAVNAHCNLLKGSTYERKRFSMENIRPIRLGSDRSTDTKFKRQSQDNRDSNNITKNWRTPYKQTKNKLKSKLRNVNTYLQSTDTSDEKMKLKILQTPVERKQKTDKQTIKKGNSEKNIRPKHSRVSSQQIDLRKAVMETPKREKLKITINQNNFFNIVIDSKARQLLKSCKSLKKFKK